MTKIEEEKLGSPGIKIAGLQICGGLRVSKSTDDVSVEILP
jgi:hypothetical protein